MGVNSYAEIFTTLIGWHMYGVIWGVLVSTGIAFLPFLVMLVEHWRTAFIDDEGGGASAGLRALELDVFVGLFVIVIACIPSNLTALSRSEVFYAPPATTATPAPGVATGAAPRSTFGGTLGTMPATVEVPVWWYSVMAISAGLSSAIISGAGMTLDDVRKVAEASRRASIDDPHLRNELQRFYNECYIPARSKFFDAPVSAPATAAIREYGPDDPEWVGSHAFRNDANLYGAMYAERAVPGWPFDPMRDRDQAGAPIEPTWGRPTCKEWWEGGSVAGLQPRIVSAVEQTSRMKSLIETFGASLSAQQRADLVAQTALDRTPMNVISSAEPGTGSVVLNTVESTGVLIGGIVTSFFTWLATAVLKPSLPFIQALLLMGIYMLMPFVLVFARYNIVTLLTGAIAIFTVKMWSVLWFVADFLDDKLALSVYPDSYSVLSALASFFEKGDATKAMLLNLVVMSMYVALPALWSGLMAMAGVRVGSMLADPLDYATQPTKAAGKEAGGLAARAIGIAGRGLGRGARTLRSRGSPGERR